MPSCDTSLGLQLDDVSLGLPFVSSMNYMLLTDAGLAETDTPGHQPAQVVTVQVSGFCMAPITLLLDHTG